MSFATRISIASAARIGSLANRFSVGQSGRGMGLPRSTFAEAWKDEFDRMSAGVEWFAMTVPGRARILKQFKADAMRKATLKERRREVHRFGRADMESIERKFKRRAHRLGVSQADLWQYE